MPSLAASKNRGNVDVREITRRPRKQLGALPRIALAEAKQERRLLGDL